jgi:hypothetical protein
MHIFTVNYLIFHLLSIKKVKISLPIILQTETTQIVTPVLPKLHDTKQNISKINLVEIVFLALDICRNVVGLSIGSHPYPLDH